MNGSRELVPRRIRATPEVRETLVLGRESMQWSEGSSLVPTLITVLARRQAGGD